MTADPFNTPEWRAMQAVEMDLHIAADTWHDRPTDPKAIAELHSRVVDYRRRRPTRASAATSTPAPRRPGSASELGGQVGRLFRRRHHPHPRGPGSGGIGCPCEEKQ